MIRKTQKMIVNFLKVHFLVTDWSDAIAEVDTMNQKMFYLKKINKQKT